MRLQAFDLRKEYQGHVALQGLNLTLHEGEVFCLLGQNGAGKTTTQLPDHQAFVRAVRYYQRQRRYFSFSYNLSKQPFGPAQLRQFPVFSY